MKDRFAALLGPHGRQIVTAMETGARFLESSTQAELVDRVGSVINEIPRTTTIDKSALPDSYGGSQTGPSDDFLVGRGLFYLGEQRRLFLDCTAGHYQMLWGYNHPELSEATREATQSGIIWDNHSNIPQAPLKQLAHRLVALANAPGETDPLDKIHLGLCTGSVACATALKIQLKVFEKNHGANAVPVIVTIEGNYHGSDMLPQFMRGMWPGLVQRCEVARVEPNDPDALKAAFKKHGDRVAGFWAEPVLMNREAIAIDASYLQLARECCDASGALMCIDEIQTGFWRPEIFDFRALGIRPDLVILGKGMTAGFHPLSGVLFKRRHDVLEQYDAISTNGSAALPAFVTLCSLKLIEESAPRLRQVVDRIQKGFAALAAEFPAQLESARGRGYLAGLKFKNVDKAKAFQQKLLAEGLWTRVHAYHERHRTILTKLGLLADAPIVDFVLSRLRTSLAALK